MLSFSRDVDLARYEPGVFGDWFLSSQVLCGGKAVERLTVQVDTDGDGEAEVSVRPSVVKMVRE